MEVLSPEFMSNLSTWILLQRLENTADQQERSTKSSSKSLTQKIRGMWYLGRDGDGVHECVSLLRSLD